MKRSLLIFALLILGLVSRCTLNLPEDPRPPKWDLLVEEIPLFSADTLRVGDEFSRDTYNRLGPDSILSINKNGQKTFGLADKLRIQSQNVHASAQLGNFEISATQQSSTEIYFTDIYPELAGHEGQQAIVPPKDLTPVEKEVTLTDFDSVNVVTGRVRLEVTNHLGMDLSGDVRLAILDQVRANAPIDTLQLGLIRDGETRFFYVDLENELISSSILAVLFGRMDGSNGQTVTLVQGARLELSVSPEDIVADAAYGANLKEQILELTDSIDLSTDSLTVRRGEIEYGSILLEITNHFNFGIGLEIDVLSITDANGDPFSLSLNLSPGQTGSDVVYLDNGVLDLDGENLKFGIKLQIFPNASNRYDLKSSDELGVAVKLSDIQFSSVTADFNIATSFPEFEEEVFPQGTENLKNFDFHDVWLKMQFLDTPFDLGLNLTFNAVRSDTSYKIVIQKNIPANGSLLLNRNGANEDQSQPTIVDLFNIIPEKMLVSGSVRVMGQNATFHKDDQMGVRYDLDFPLMFTTKNSHYSKTDSLNIDEDARQKIRDYTYQGSINVSLVNSLPISGFLSLFVGPDSNHVDSEIFTIVLPRPTLRNDGVVAQPASGSFVIELTKQKFTEIADSYFLRFEASLDDTPEATLTANDYLIVKDVFINGKFLIDPDNL
ncbi:MAG: hypothetical protein GXO74_12405 [Calditrichaeota bacterium]|nr:hypothetical protein [Calditrichota bacterium]